MLKYFIGLVLVLFTTLCFHLYRENNLLAKEVDSEYVKGFNDALDCRAMLSAPMCEIVLEKAGK